VKKVWPKMRVSLTALGLSMLLSSAAFARTTGKQIDLYFGDWHTSASRTIRGELVERDILTRGDPFQPAKKGAVLRFIDSYVYATVRPGASTTPTRLDGQQEIYFVETGRGTISAGGQKARLFRNIAVLMPADLRFTIRNTGTEPLGMYVINEPITPGFRPNQAMLVRDENKLPIASTDGMWSHIVKKLFVTQDGLATLQSVLTVTLDPLTIGKPHPAPDEDTSGIEEVWTELYGTSLALIGNRLRRQTPGMAYLHIPDNRTPHTNMNTNPNAQVKFLYFARYKPHATRK
jgi:mannose-6-phosphate isomerase-like protein (cupin superfamily)